MTQTLAITSITLRSGEEAPPRIQSWLFWRELFAGNIPEAKNLAVRFRQNGYVFPGTKLQYLAATRKMFEKDVCHFCDSAGTRRDEYGYYYCICWLLEYADSLRNDDALAGDSAWSAWAHKKLDDLKPHGGEGEQSSWKSAQAAIDRVKEWIEYPDKWLLLVGPTGVGKTHMLFSIMDVYYPFAKYCVASELETKFRQGIDNNTLQQLILDLQNVPILVLDDVGIEWATDWITSKFDQVIEYRSRKNHWHDHLTVSATNIPLSRIRGRFTRDGVSRVGSRLTDTEIVDTYSIKLQDYRLLK